MLTLFLPVFMGDIQYQCRFMWKPERVLTLKSLNGYITFSNIHPFVKFIWQLEPAQKPALSQTKGFAIAGRSFDSFSLILLVVNSECGDTRSPEMSSRLGA